MDCAIKSRNDTYGCLRLNQLQFFLVENAKHVFQLMAPFQDQSGRRNDRVSALAAGKLGPLFDAVKRHFAGAAEDAEDGGFAQIVDGVVAPFAADHAPAVGLEDGVQFPAVEMDNAL